MAESELFLDTEESEDVAQFLAMWEQLGRDAIGSQPTAPRALRTIIADCSELVVHRLWLDNGRNITETARTLHISRKRVRELVKAWHRAQGLTVITSPSLSTAPEPTLRRQPARMQADDKPVRDR